MVDGFRRRGARGISEGVNGTGEAGGEDKERSGTGVALTPQRRALEGKEPSTRRVLAQVETRRDAQEVRLRAPLEVGPGIYILGTKWVNFYLITEGDEAILVDAGYSRYDSQLTQLLATLGLSMDAISAVFVTHHHVDHVGTAELARANGAQVFAHERDVAKISGRTASHPPSGFFRESWRPIMLGYLLHTTLAGGAVYTPVSTMTPVNDGQRFDLPGHPQVIATPGHTAGHYSIHLPDHGTLFAGDALMNFDYATGEQGPKLHRFNENRSDAQSSLEALASLEATTVLFGHGDPWSAGLPRAIDEAKQRAAAGA